MHELNGCPPMKHIKCTHNGPTHMKWMIMHHPPAHPLDAHKWDAVCIMMPIHLETHKSYAKHIQTGEMRNEIDDTTSTNTPPNRIG